jgi:hypothetical protein
MGPDSFKSRLKASWPPRFLGLRLGTPGLSEHDKHPRVLAGADHHGATSKTRGVESKRQVK